jgi:hypothetical protein
MQLEFQDRTWQLDLTDINLKPAMVIQAYTGMPVGDWLDSLNDEADPDGKITKRAANQPGFLKSFAALYWLMLWQNGEPTPIGDVDFPVGAFSEVLRAATNAEAPAEPEVAASDPTQPPPVWEPSPEPSSPTSAPPELPDDAQGGVSPDG